MEERTEVVLVTGIEEDKEDVHEGDVLGVLGARSESSRPGGRKGTALEFSC